LVDEEIMAHFAEIDSNNIVLRVIVVADEHEENGEESLSWLAIPV
jgi:hypothetical protein